MHWRTFNERRRGFLTRGFLPASLDDDETASSYHINEFVKKDGME